MSDSVDSKIWEKSIEDKNNVDLFKTTPGGPKLPEKKLFKTPKENKLEKRVKDLEGAVEELEKELQRIKVWVINKTRNVNR